MLWNVGRWVSLLCILTLSLSRTGAFSITWPGDEDSEDGSMSIEEGRQEKRGGCNGFPCVFSHLGTKASDATIERIKMSILMDCLNDPHCITQGRRKRIPPSDVRKQKLMFGKRFSDYEDLDWLSYAQALQKRKRK